MLLTILATLAGACLYAAAHHLWIGRQRPPRPVHTWFALLSFLIACYVLVKLAAYRAATGQELVDARRVEIAVAMVIFAFLPWFVSHYTGFRNDPALIALSAIAFFLFAVNFALPFGINFVELPTLRHMVLPWGERVADLRVHQRGAWYYAGWAYILLCFAWSAFMCARQYRYGDRRKSVALASALAVFLAFVLFNQAVNVGLVNFTHTAEFGFVALVLLMGIALSRELRAGGDALLASETRFRTLVEQSPLSIQVLAPDGRTLQVNRAWESLWGVTLDALSNHNILRDPRLTENGMAPYIHRAFNGEAVEIPPIIHNSSRARDGASPDRWIRAFIYPVKDHTGRISEIILMHEDVTERKRTEDALRQISAGVSARTGEDFFNHLVKHLAALFGADYAFVGLLDGARPGTIVTLSAYAQGERGSSMVYKLDDTPGADIVGQTTRAYPSGVQRLFPKDRLLADMNVDGYLGTPLFDAQGAPIGLIVVLSKKPLERVEHMREILEIFAARTSAEIQRLRAERELEANRASLEQRVRDRTAQLESANSELEAFSYSVSHDLRAPLRAIDGFSHALVEDYAERLDAKARDYFMRMRNATRRMGDLIDDLLNLSRVGRADLHRDPVDFSALAREVAAELQRAEPGRSVELVIAPNLNVVGSSALLRIALHNLLGNAWKYTRRAAHPRVELAQTAHDGTCCWFVRDNGVGFDMQFAEHLFAPFRRLHPAGEFEGSGIGLAIVARIIRRHGGRIWAEAEIDRGATFYFTLGEGQP